MTLPLDALFLISCLHIALFLLLKRVERVSCWRPARQPMMDRTAVSPPSVHFHRKKRAIAPAKRLSPLSKFFSGRLTALFC